jgi:tRNA pseudouridine55 synthase
MENKIVLLYKKLGQTPLECIWEYKKKTGEERPMTYAGRLDPMAEGLLLCLIGEECKNKDQYLGLNKKYVFEILIGFSTDTHDLLGLVEEYGHITTVNNEFNDLLKSFIGKRNQIYPIYSSKTVDGKQLHTLARAGLIDEDNIPSKEIEIFSLDKIDEIKIDRENLIDEIIKKINLVKGDFRQKEIIEKWKNVISKEDKDLKDNFSIIKIEMTCSSGTYVRALVRDLSKLSGIPMCTYSIVRTEIGEYLGCTSA